MFLVSLGPFLGRVTGSGQLECRTSRGFGNERGCFVSFIAGVFPDCGLLPLSWSPEGSTPPCSEVGVESEIVDPASVPEEGKGALCGAPYLRRESRTGGS